VPRMTEKTPVARFRGICVKEGRYLDKRVDAPFTGLVVAVARCVFFDQSAESPPRLSRAGYGEADFGR
jgi:hypothetical protein